MQENASSKQSGANSGSQPTLTSTSSLSSSSQTASSLLHGAQPQAGKRKRADTDSLSELTSEEAQNAGGEAKMSVLEVMEEDEEDDEEGDMEDDYDILQD